VSIAVAQISKWFWMNLFLISSLNLSYYYFVVRQSI
jgi:hypothetical protein